MVRRIALLLLLSAGAVAAEVDLSRAVVVAPEGLNRREQKAVTLLVEEVEKRTGRRLAVSHQWPSPETAVVAVGPVAALPRFAGPYASSLDVAGKRPQAGMPTPPPPGPEGYRLLMRREPRAAPAVFVIGADSRGVLFGAGHLLRALRMTKGSITLADSLDVSTAPRYALRGHQLGYRPKTNSYDGWTVALWEQYIRDLAVFGANAVELIPPRSDDAADSPHFPLPQMEMMVEMSRLLDDYGLDVWIWYPALDKDYSDPATVEFALKEWGEVFRKLPRVDAVFVPGGDPGHSRPRILMALLERQTANLRRYHPRAQMWVSPQSFNQEWMEEFYEILRKQQPAWLSGVVFGPQIRVSLAQLRAAIPKRYPIRHYPDITHSRQSQYPVPDWDTAYALTEGREGINPRPLGQARIFRLLQPHTMGFITYSEGCNDDVNKMVWSALGWDPEADVTEVLRQYGRYFIGERRTDEFTQGLLALERNWQGPLLANSGVYAALKQFQAMERSATPQELLNWRFQQVLYRAYYDAYTRSRLIYETDLEAKAREKLRQAPKTGSLAAAAEAEAILDRAATERVSQDWRARVFELAEALYQSIRMQLSVERYKAISLGRGANLDAIDQPLNSRVWLKQRFAELRRLSEEADRLRRIDEIVNWDNPGPGGFYDDLGNLSRQPHLVRGPGFDSDPAFLESSLVGFGYFGTGPVSWWQHAESLNDAPLKMRYTGLDRAARYKVRVVYAGDTPKRKIGLLADDSLEVHPLVDKPSPVRPVEFDIPAKATEDGELTLTWHQEPGLGGNGRGCQVAEVWLIKK